MMKEQILELLRAATDHISGEELCHRFKVSRTAIWKHIKDLQTEGYEIEAIRNKGYKLVSVPDVVNAAEIRPRLNTQRMGQHIVDLETVDSTNVLAYKLAERGEPDGTLVIADQQTGGKGRRGRSWFSPPGTGIWMSLILRPQLPMVQAPLLTLVAAVAVSQVLTEATGYPAGIKWPNDILFDFRKCCGILTEMNMESDAVKFVIVGIGINVNQVLSDFPEELADKATSLRVVTGQKHLRAPLVRDILERFEVLYNRFLEEGNFASIREMWKKQSITIGQRIRVQTPPGEISGTAFDLDEMGALWVRDDSGKVHKIYSGDILFTSPTL